MPAITFEGALCTGDGCFPPRPNNDGDSTFLVNGTPAHVEGNSWPVHSCGDNQHPGELASGSPTFLINGQEAGRIGDPLGGGCSAAVAEGDETFLVDD